MDSGKFKKIDNNNPKNKKRKRNKKHKNYSIKQENYHHNKRRNNKIKRFKEEEIYNRQEKRHNKQKTLRYKNLLILCSILLALIVMGLFGASLIQKTNIPSDAELIKPVGFNLTPYGYDWNNELYGEAIVQDENATNSTYYFTLSQMAALASYSDNSFNYTDGIYVTYNTNNSRNVKVVDAIYTKGGKEIVKPDDFDVYSFLTDARFTGRKSQYCLEGFGFTEEEYKNSIF